MMVVRITAEQDSSGWWYVHAGGPTAKENLAGGGLVASSYEKTLPEAWEHFTARFAKEIVTLGIGTEEAKQEAVASLTLCECGRWVEECSFGKGKCVLHGRRFWPKQEVAP